MVAVAAVHNMNCRRFELLVTDYISGPHARGSDAHKLTLRLQSMRLAAVTLTQELRGCST